MVNFICCYVLFDIIMEVPAIHIFANDVPTLLRLLKLIVLRMMVFFYGKDTANERAGHLMRRNIESSDESVLDVPQSIEDLPEAEPIHPGHTLLQPSFKMLKSAVKYPQKPDTVLVYGNLDNLGITYGRTSQRVLYTNFRKSNDLVNILRQAIQNIMDINRYKSDPYVILIEIDPVNLYQSKAQLPDSDYYSKVTEVDNNASEILDSTEYMNEENGINETRRKKKSKSKHKDSDTSYEKSTSESESSSESDHERNPGNPYTVFKDKYKQNWLWNHAMDGDHMNVNPYAPQFASVGPSGAALFFGRKWWYYNQDDFRPLN